MLPSYGRSCFSLCGGRAQSPASESVDEEVVIADGSGLRCSRVVAAACYRRDLEEGALCRRLCSAAAAYHRRDFCVMTMTGGRLYSETGRRAALREAMLIAA